VTLVVTAIGLVLILEGLVYALAPSAVEQMLDALKSMPMPARRLIGLIAIVLGGLCLTLAGVV